jgi:hypothetical protein
MRALILISALFGLLRANAACAQWTRSLELVNAPFDQPGPDAIVHAPAGFDPSSPIELVVFLHGYRGCIEVLAASGPARCGQRAEPQPGWALLDHHDEAGTNTLFVLIQLAFDRADGSAGRFQRHARFRAFLDELLGQIPELGARRGVHDLASLTILAHSAAFETSLAIVRQGGIDELDTRLVLLDALYAGGPTFLEWVAASPRRRLINIHGRRGSTADRSRDLRRRARRASSHECLGHSLEELGACRVVDVETLAAHAEVPARFIAPVLRALRP